MSSTGDAIHELPVNKEQAAKPGDLELMHNLFQPSNKVAIANIASPFKLAFVGALLFGVLSLPLVGKLVDGYFKGNVVMGKIALMVVFMVLYFLIQKLWIKAAIRH